MRGGLNLRDDSLFNKLDVSPKGDVSKLIKMQKEVNNNNIKKQINDSLDVIEDNFSKLEILSDISRSNINNESIQDKLKQDESKQDKINTQLARILIKLETGKNSNNFMSYTANLYKIFYSLCKEEKILFNVNKTDSIDAKVHECIKKILNDRILVNLKLFKIYSLHYQPGKFLKIIEKIEKRILNIEPGKQLTDLYNKIENFKYIFELDVYYSIIFGQNLLDNKFDEDKRHLGGDNDFILIHPVTLIKNSTNQYDKETAIILLSRIKALDKIYDEIRKIVTDPTFKTLLDLVNDKELFYKSLEINKDNHFINIANLKNKLGVSGISTSESSDSISGNPDEDVLKILETIFDIDSFSENKNYFDIFKKYKSNLNKYIKGGTINIEKPVSDLEVKIKELNLGKYPSKILTLNQVFSNKDKKQGGGKMDNKVDLEKSEFINDLKNKIENVNADVEQVESIVDSTKRYANKLFSDVKNKINTQKPIENESKILDDSYEDILKQFDPNKIKSMNYEKLRKTIYRIKNHEYFDNIKIENEDVYTFIAATYILRVISLYMTSWFIEIEILKDVESVILSYILMYIMLFLLTYTFVNLSDNKLNTTKGYLYYFYSRVNFDYTRFIIHLGILFLLIIIPFIIRVTDKDSTSYKQTSDEKKQYLNKLISNMSAIIWVILSIIAFFFK